jgi:hypothetical protein
VFICNRLCRICTIDSLETSKIQKRRGIVTIQAYCGCDAPVESAVPISTTEMQGGWRRVSDIPKTSSIVGRRVEPAGVVLGLLEPRLGISKACLHD